MSACPQDLTPVNGAAQRPTDAHFRLHDPRADPQANPRADPQADPRPDSRAGDEPTTRSHDG